MADASRSELPRRAALGVADTWRRLNFEQRIAGVGALLLIVSTFGPFSFVEAAIVLIGVAVLFLLRRRAEGREFHIPFGDGTVIAAAGAWSALLILIRLLDRPLGQNLLAIVCAAMLLIAGIAERRKRPPDDLPGPAPDEHQRGPDAVDWEERPARKPRRSDSATEQLDEEVPSERDDSGSVSLDEEAPDRSESATRSLPSPDPADEPTARRWRARPKARTDSEQLSLEDDPSDQDTPPRGLPKPDPVDDPTIPLPPPEFDPDYPRKRGRRRPRND
jgi:hypothetical protein